MPENRTCSSCGAKLQAAETLGLCDSCHVRQGLEEGRLPGSADDLAISTGPRSGHGENDDGRAADLLHFRGDQTGDPIGGYKLLQKLGEGGMGSVWSARQDAPVRREVALKLIKFGMDTKEVLARFEAERQALALMN